MIIYKVTNLINDKTYIGQTIFSLKNRKLSHINKANNNKHYFARALTKYGSNNFKWKIICICPNIETLNEQEQYYIAFYDSINNGYNLTKGGNGTMGYRHTEKAKNKMSITHKNMSDKTRQKIGIASKGRKHSEESKQKISKAIKGDKNPMYGKHHTEETKRKMQKNNTKSWLGKYHSKESIKKMKDNHVGMTGKTHSEKTKKKMSIARQNISEETRKKMSIAASNISDETRRKMSENHKGMLGKTHSKETKLKISIAQKKRRRKISVEVEEQ